MLLPGVLPPTLTSRPKPCISLISTLNFRVHYDGIDSRRDIPLPEILDQWESTQAELMRTLNELSDDDWRSPAPYETDEPTDLGGMIETILVQPPRPLYRHLPVHVPNVGAYVRRLKEG